MFFVLGSCSRTSGRTHFVNAFMLFPNVIMTQIILLFKMFIVMYKVSTFSVYVFSCMHYTEVCVCCAVFQAQLAQKTTLLNDSKLKEQEFREKVRN